MGNTPSKTPSLLAEPKPLEADPLDGIAASHTATVDKRNKYTNLAYLVSGLIAVACVTLLLIKWRAHDSAPQQHNTGTLTEKTNSTPSTNKPRSQGSYASISKELLAGTATEPEQKNKSRTINVEPVKIKLVPRQQIDTRPSPGAAQPTVENNVSLEESLLSEILGLVRESNED